MIFFYATILWIIRFIFVLVLAVVVFGLFLSLSQ